MKIDKPISYSYKLPLTTSLIQTVPSFTQGLVIIYLNNNSEEIKEVVKAIMIWFDELIINIM